MNKINQYMEVSPRILELTIALIILIATFAMWAIGRLFKQVENRQEGIELKAIRKLYADRGAYIRYLQSELRHYNAWFEDEVPYTDGQKLKELFKKAGI